MKYIITPFKKIFDFTGKSSINEFWIFYLFMFITAFLSAILSGITRIEYLDEIWTYVILLPVGISLGFRRLNDVGINKFLFLIPMVNLILAALPKDNTK